MVERERAVCAVGRLVRLHACGRARGARWDMLACPWSVGAGVWMPRNHTQRSLLAVHMHNVKIGGHTGSMQKRLKRQVHRSYGGNKIYTPFKVTRPVT